MPGPASAASSESEPAAAPGPDDARGRRGGGPRPSTRLVVLLGALAAFAPIGIDMYLPAFPRIARDLHTTAGALGLSLSVFLAGLAIGQLVCGPISDRLGRRGPLLAGCAVFAVASAACAGARSIEALIAARFLMGLGGSAGLVVARAVVRDLFDVAGSARMYSMMMLVTGVAPVLAPSLGERLLTFAGWRSIFWAVAACGAACGGAVALGLGETLPPARRARGPVADLPRQYGAMLGDGRFLASALAVALGSGLLFAYLAGSPFAFMELYGLSPRAYGRFFASNAVGLFGAAQVNRRLLRSFGADDLLRRASAGGAVVGVLLLAVAVTGLGGFAAFFGLLFACMATLGIIFPNATAAAMAPYAGRAGGASALLGMLQYTIGAASGAAVGLLHDGTAVPMAGVVASCAVGGALLTLAGRARAARGSGPGFVG